MKRWGVAALGAIAIATAGVSGVLLSVRGEAARADDGKTPALSPAGASEPFPSRVAHTGGDSVRVEHAIIRVDVPVRFAAPPRSRPQRAAGSPPALRADRTPLVQRARRVLIGDGRYRPEPFPRPAPR